MMLLKKLWAALFWGGVCLISCDRTEDFPLSNNNDFTLELECVKSAWSQDSRTVIDDEGRGNFEEGDRIDVLTKDGEETSNVWLQYEGGKWTPSLKRLGDGQGTWAVSALFPVLPQPVGDVTRRILNLT